MLLKKYYDDLHDDEIAKVAWMLKAAMVKYMDGTTMECNIYPKVFFYSDFCLAARKKEAEEARRDENLLNSFYDDDENNPYYYM